MAGSVGSHENNLKRTGQESGLFPRLIPKPHGASATHMEELRAFSRSAWIRLFEQSGFEVHGILQSPYSSGYRFGFDGARRLVESLGLGSENIYILTKAGHHSPSLHWFLPR